MKCKIKKDDLVEVISGNEATDRKAGRVTRGRVLEVNPQAATVLVEGVNLRKHHEKIRQTKGGQTGGIEEREAPIHISNVMIVDPKTDKAARVGFKVVDGKRVRYTKGKNASGTTLE